VRWQYAVGADDAAGLGFAHQQVVAIHVEFVVIDRLDGVAQPCTHFLREDAVTQALGLFQVGRTARHADTKRRRIGVACLGKRHWGVGAGGCVVGFEHR